MRDRQADFGSPARRFGDHARDRPPAVRDFLDRLAASPHPNVKGSSAILGEFYHRCINPKARDLGLRELHQQVDEINRIETLPDFARALGALHRRGIIRALIRTDASWEAVAPDERSVARISLANPKLPREAYAKNSSLLAEYLKHWQTLATLIGGIPPSEIEGARRVDRWLASARDEDGPEPETALQPLVSSARLEGAAFPWPAFLSGLGLAPSVSIRPAGPNTLNRIDALTEGFSCRPQDNLKLAIVERWAEYVGVPVFQEEIRFHQEVVDEKDHEVFELRQACTDLTSRDLNPWLDEAFLAGLPTPHRQPAQEMFGLLRDRFAQTVAAATWLDRRTREAAAAKVRRVALRFIADSTPGLDDVVLPAGSFLDADLRTRAHFSELYLGEIGSIVERKST